MNSNGQIILIDDEEHIRISGKQTLELAGFEVECFEDARKALPRLSKAWNGIVVTDIRMPKMDGLAFLKSAIEIDPKLPVILVTGHGDIPMAVSAMRDGAYDFLEKPFAADRLVELVKRGLEQRLLIMENRTLRDELEAQKSNRGPAIIGKSPAVAKLRNAIANLANADATVLISGNTGTGKELVARCLHEGGLRHRCPFVPLNCAAMPETLFEMELFGQEAGINGAEKPRLGKIEYGNGGTLFLDEIESMPMALQAKLLRFIQEREIFRVGGNRAIPINMRIVAATKIDLREAVSEGTFREDLYYHLDVSPLHLPPLKERREDIPLLFAHFVQLASQSYDRSVPPLEQERMQALLAYGWPGNVRELRNTAERYVLDPQADILEETQESDGDNAGRGASLAEQVKNFEKSLIAEQLRLNQGNVKATIEALGLPRKTFYDKMAKYGLDRKDFS